MKRVCSSPERHWRSTRNSTTYWVKQMLCNCLVGCCMKTRSLMLQNKPYPKQLISSQKRRIHLWSADAIETLVIYTSPGVRQRRPSIALREPLGLHPLSTGMMNIFGTTTPLHNYLLSRGSPMKLKAMPTMPSYMQAMTHPFWAMQCSCRLIFGISSRGL